MNLREEVRAKISDAYYDARNAGQTMETAADVAADAVLAVVKARLLSDEALKAAGAAMRPMVSAQTWTDKRHGRPVLSAAWSAITGGDDE